MDVEADAQGHREHAQDGRDRSEQDRPEARTARKHDRFPPGFAVFKELVHVVDQDDGVVDDHPGQSYDADAGHDDHEYLPRQHVAPEDAPGGQEYRAHDDQRINQGIELDDQDDGDKEKGDHESLDQEAGGFLLDLDSVPRFYAVSVGQVQSLDRCLELGADFGFVLDVGFEVGVDLDCAAQVLPLDDPDGRFGGDLGDAGQGNADPFLSGNQEIAQLVDGVALPFAVADDDVVLFGSLPERSGFGAVEGAADGLRDLGGGQAQERGFLPVDHHGELRFGGLVVALDALEFRMRFQYIEDLVGDIAEDRVILADDIVGYRMTARRTALDFLEGHFGAGETFHCGLEVFRGLGSAYVAVHEGTEFDAQRGLVVLLSAAAAADNRLIVFHRRGCGRKDGFRPAHELVRPVQGGSLPGFEVYHRGRRIGGGEEYRLLAEKAVGGEAGDHDRGGRAYDPPGFRHRARGEAGVQVLKFCEPPGTFGDLATVLLRNAQEEGAEDRVDRHRDEER